MIGSSSRIILSRISLMLSISVSDISLEKTSASLNHLISGGLFLGSSILGYFNYFAVTKMCR